MIDFIELRIEITNNDALPDEESRNVKYLLKVLIEVDMRQVGFQAHIHQALSCGMVV